MVIVSGNILPYEIDNFIQYSKYLQSNNKKKLKIWEYYGDIQCYFNEKSVVAKLSKGKRITIIGSCSGLLMNVQMDNCIIK